MQTLYAPWGFGEEVVATDRELNQKIGENARRAFWRVDSHTKNSGENLANFLVLGIIINIAITEKHNEIK